MSDKTESPVIASGDGWVLDDHIAPGAHLKQGDLIKFSDSDPLKQAGIVVTADCDLERKKHARLVTLVPVIPIRVVLERYLLLDDLENKRLHIAKFLFKSLGVEMAQDEVVNRAIVEHRLANDDICRDDTLKFAATFILDQSEFVPVDTYKSLMHHLGMQPKGAKAVAQQARGRGDLMLLPDPSTLGVDGNIAWVRHVWQYPLNGIAIRTSELKYRNGERVARLNSPYRYRLTQLMAQVFSDIGLPNIPDSMDENLESLL